LDYSKYFTPQHIAELLVEYLDIPEPKAVIDICCGSCNLLYAAKKRWPNIHLKGVDIVAHETDGVEFEQLDGRQYATRHSKEYPLVLANPPFAYVERKREFPELYQDCFEQYDTSRLENEMVLANLLLLDEHGVLVIIMPSTFVEGITSARLRCMIGKKYLVESIIKLPEDTFGSKHISSYALVISCQNKQEKDTESCRVDVCEGGHKIICEGYISRNKMNKGEWNLHSCIECSNSIEMSRGNISSAQFAEKGIPVLHTARYCSEWKPSVRYIAKIIGTPVYAEDGDIIVSRIGKSCGQWFRYTGESVLISDCLFRIKDSDGTVFKRIEGKQFSYSPKGVATRYITMNDFKQWYISLQ